MTMTTARLNEIRTFDVLDVTPNDANGMIDELATEIERLKKENAELQKDSTFLQNLRNAGVDNWDGYHYGYGSEDEDDE